MHRRGFTLIEMVAALTVGTVIMGIGVGMVHLLLRTERTGRGRVPQSRIVARLAQQFRSDVNAAERQVAGAKAAQWQFELAQHRLVSYRAVPGGVEWNERKDGKLVRQEVFVLPREFSAAISGPGRTTPAVLNLVITDKAEPWSPGRELLVTAVLGKDQRFTKPPAGRK
jgi:prepilin-type N-terminal cleavage/methylation domain-containing protein